VDFLKILRSFEEFLFEAMTWLLFYPLTLWRIVTRPLTSMRYSDGEQGDGEEGRYDDAISPPLFLLFTLILTNLVGFALHIPRPPGGSALLKVIEASPQNLILFRSLVFSLLPLVAAVTLLVAQGTRLSRQSLRAPFYAQCYLVAPLAMALSGGGLIYQRSDLYNGWAAGLVAVAAFWFVVAEARWFAKELNVSGLKALGLTGLVVLVALLYFIAIAIPVAAI
jgi:hypothetical protein